MPHPHSPGRSATPTLPTVTPDTGRCSAARIPEDEGECGTGIGGGDKMDKWGAQCWWLHPLLASPIKGEVSLHSWARSCRILDLTPPPRWGRLGGGGVRSAGLHPTKKGAPTGALSDLGRR